MLRKSDHDLEDEIKSIVHIWQALGYVGAQSCAGEYGLDGIHRVLAQSVLLGMVVERQEIVQVT